MEKLVTNDYFLTEVYKKIFVTKDSSMNKDLITENFRTFSPSREITETDIHQSTEENNTLRPYKTSRCFKPLTAVISKKQLNSERNQKLR